MLKNRKKFIALFLSFLVIFSMVGFTVNAVSEVDDIPSDLSREYRETIFDDIPNGSGIDVDDVIIDYTGDITELEDEFILWEENGKTRSWGGKLIITILITDTDFSWRIQNITTSIANNVKMNVRIEQNGLWRTESITVAYVSPGEIYTTGKINYEQKYITEQIEYWNSAAEYGTSFLYTTERKVSDNLYSHWYKGNRSSVIKNVEYHYSVHYSNTKSIADYCQKSSHFWYAKPVKPVGWPLNQPTGWKIGSDQQTYGGSLNQPIAGVFHNNYQRILTREGGLIVGVYNHESSGKMMSYWQD